MEINLNEYNFAKTHSNVNRVCNNCYKPITTSLKFSKPKLYVDILSLIRSKNIHHLGKLCLATWVIF